MCNDIDTRLYLLSINFFPGLKSNPLILVYCENFIELSLPEKQKSLPQMELLYKP